MQEFGAPLRVILLMWAVLAPWATADADASDPKRVLILHSVGREFRPWNEYAKDIRAELDRRQFGRSTCRNIRWSRHDQVAQKPRNCSLIT
jgi:hypothetical protein